MTVRSNNIRQATLKFFQISTGVNRCRRRSKLSHPTTGPVTGTGYLVGNSLVCLGREVLAKWKELRDHKDLGIVAVVLIAASS
jgi:hypothetical protein